MKRSRWRRRFRQHARAAWRFDRSGNWTCERSPYVEKRQAIPPAAPTTHLSQLLPVEHECVLDRLPFGVDATGSHGESLAVRRHVDAIHDRLFAIFLPDRAGGRRAPSLHHDDIGIRITAGDAHLLAVEVAAVTPLHRRAVAGHAGHL